MRRCAGRLLAITTPAAAKVRPVQVGPIWNQHDAQQKCAAAARQAGGTWTGQWRTTRPGQMSECDIRTDHDRERIRSVEVGPIWNQMDANQKCPAAAQREGGQWTGQWRTIRPGMMSVCDVSTHRGMDFRIGGGSSVSGTYNGGSKPGRLARQTLDRRRPDLESDRRAAKMPGSGAQGRRGRGPATGGRRAPASRSATSAGKQLSGAWLRPAA